MTLSMVGIDASRRDETVPPIDIRFPIRIAGSSDAARNGVVVSETGPCEMR
jgi:hypothetical protein